MPDCSHKRSPDLTAIGFVAILWYTRYIKKRTNVTIRNSFNMEVLSFRHSRIHKKCRTRVFLLLIICHVSHLILYYESYSFVYPRQWCLHPKPSLNSMFWPWCKIPIPRGDASLTGFAHMLSGRDHSAQQVTFTYITHAVPLAIHIKFKLSINYFSHFHQFQTQNGTLPKCGPRRGWVYE